MTVWLLDTCVIVDYLRDRPEAVELHSSRGPTPVGFRRHGRRGPRRRAQRRIEGLLGQLWAVFGRRVQGESRIPPLRSRYAALLSQGEHRGKRDSYHRA